MNVPEDCPSHRMIEAVMDAYDRDNVSLDLHVVSEDLVEVFQIWSEKERRAGHGNKAMTLLTETADLHGVSLQLLASTLLYDENQCDGDDFTDLMDDLNKQAMSNEQLAAWYARHGFVPTGEYEDDRPLMRRMPEPVPSPSI